MAGKTSCVFLLKISQDNTNRYIINYKYENNSLWNIGY